jgi:acetoin utilization protein AcuC
MKSFFIYSKEGADFEYSPDHPFRPERTDMTFELSKKYGLFDEPWISIVPPESIPEEILLIFHTEGYLNALKAAGRGEITEDTAKAGLGTSDNPIFPEMFEKSNLAAGGTLVGMRHVLETEGEARSFNTMGGFHHAFPDYAEGFCYINDLCIAGKLLRKDGKRFCYIDVDAHHGNAVEHAFYEDDGALVISMHQSGHTLYPGTGFENEIGKGKGKGTNINIPLPPQTDDDLALKAFYEIVPPAVSAFSPDLIIAQLGVDAVSTDPLANLSLTNNSFERMVQEICSMTNKLVATGGGGYNVDNVSRSWTLAWAAMNGIELVNPYAGVIGGLLAGPEIEGGDLTDMHIYVTGPTKERNTKEIDRIITYIKETVFPIIGAKG